MLHKDTMSTWKLRHVMCFKGCLGPSKSLGLGYNLFLFLWIFATVLNLLLCFLPFLFGHSSRYWDNNSRKYVTFLHFLLETLKSTCISFGLKDIFPLSWSSSLLWPHSSLAWSYLSALVPRSVLCSHLCSWYLCIFIHFLCWRHPYLYPGTLMTYSLILFRSLLKHDASSETSPGQLIQTLNDIKVYHVTLAFLCFF